MNREDKDLADFLQSVTDALCGEPFGVHTAHGKATATPSAEMEASHMRQVWELLDQLSPPEPDDTFMDRLFRAMMNRSASHELADDQLDLAAGTAGEQEPKDPNDKDKNKS